jgi:hypothetical protein
LLFNNLLSQIKQSKHFWLLFPLLFTKVLLLNKALSRVATKTIYSLELPEITMTTHSLRRQLEFSRVTGIKAENAARPIVL